MHAQACSKGEERLLARACPHNPSSYSERESQLCTENLLNGNEKQLRHAMNEATDSSSNNSKCKAAASANTTHHTSFDVLTEMTMVPLPLRAQDMLSPVDASSTALVPEGDCPWPFSSTVSVVGEGDAEMPEGVRGDAVRVRVTELPPGTLVPTEKSTAVTCTQMCVCTRGGMGGGSRTNAVWW